MMRYATFTHNGGRPVNEDTIAVCDGGDKLCFVVCDGLGGHGMGDAASQFVAAHIVDAFTRADKVDDGFLDACFPAAQEALSQEQKEKKLHQKMKTTAVCMTVQKRKAHVAYVGDSRFYAFGRRGVACQSEDHSVPYMLYLSGQIAADEIRHHPDRNLLMRVMGTDWDAPKHQLLRPMPLWQYRAFLLCTDGFWELITEETMSALLRTAATPQEWLDAMVAEVWKNGEGKEMDNFSAIAIFCK